MAQAEVLNQESLAKQVLQETFGYQQFRPGQETIINTVLDRRRQIAVLPDPGAGEKWFNGGGFAADFVDERSGRPAAG